MATLVLSAAGAALGGPVGSAIGSFVGRQVDRSFGRGRSARLTDLRAPSSQYGDPIPTVLRRMRVAGTVLWSATPVATATVSKSGTGQGSSVSFAYGLSSGRVEQVSRIWADGRLIRDAEGRQEVSFGLRLHDGNEDQLCDPLIASVLGEDRAPAFRGIAYLMVENFDLSSFGNRLPLITVEVVADGDRITAENILRDALSLAGEESAADHEIEGYALTGDDQASALAPLSEAFGPNYSFGSVGWSLTPPNASHIIDDALWVFGAGGMAGSRLSGASERPTRVSVRYFDPAIDFAAGEKSARVPGQERLRRIELPAALTSERAKAAAFEQLAKAGDASRELWLSLPLSFARIGLGDQIACAGQPEQRYRVCGKIIARGELKLRVRRDASAVAPMPSEAGGATGAAVLARKPLSIALVELPGEVFDSEPEVAILVCGGHDPFRAMPLSITVGGSEQELATASLPAPQGSLLAPLANAPSGLVDKQSAIDVMFEHDPILLSCDEATLLSGANLVCVNGEFIQFATAELIGEASYRLSGLVRGRFDSDVSTPHPAGSKVLLLEPGAFSSLKVPRGHIGAEVLARVHGPDEVAAEASLTVTGPAARPWAPDHVVAAEVQNGLQVSWVRRCKEGAPWVDGVDAPIGASRESYLVSLDDLTGGRIEVRSETSEVLIDLQALAQLGPRPWRLEVRQLGDFVASKPRLHIID